MRRLILLASAAAITLAVAPASHAQSRSNQDCPRGQQTCSQPLGNRTPTPQRTEAQRGDGQAAQSARTAPRVGATGRNGQRFERAANSRFSPPPRGQEYRVVNDHLVLVDNNTLAIVAVVGLLNSLLN